MVPSWVPAAVAAAAGGSLALGYLAALRYSAHIYLERDAVKIAVLVHLARWAALVGAFVVAARVGPRTLVPLLFGFVLVHTSLLVHARSRS